MGIYDRNYYQEDNESWRPRAAGTGRSLVATLIIINVVIFFIDAFSADHPEGGKIISHFMALDSRTPWAIWQYLTYGFAHSSINSQVGIFHLLGNMIMLFVLGRPMEHKLGRDEFLKFYLLAIVFSGLVFMLVNLISGRPAACVGASGAVTGVVFLFVFNYPNQMLYLMGVVPVKTWILGVIWVGYDVLQAFDPNNNVAVEAHMGGLAFACAYHFLGWNFRWIRTEKLAALFQRRTHLKVHHPDDDPGAAAISDQADRVLQKVHEEGEESLTRKERKILERYSRQVRKKPAVMQ